MKNRKKQILCLVMSAVYVFSLFISAPIQANAQTASATHRIAAYTKAQKAKTTKALIAALTKLPASSEDAMKMTSADLKKLIDGVNTQITTARKMKLSYTYFKNYDRLDLAKTAYTTLIVNEKAAAAQLAEDQVKSKAVSDMIAVLPQPVTKADAAKVAMARTAYMGLSIAQMKMVTNLDTLVAAERLLGELNSATIASVEPYKTNSIRVTFTNIPDNYVNVIFTVTKNGSPLVMTPSWADGRLEAILTTPSGVTEGIYTVSVKEGERDLGTKTLVFEKQKVSKIVFNPLNYIMGTTNAGTQRCYAAYKVFDQYGSDITSTDIAASVRFSSNINGIDIERRGGVIVFTPVPQLLSDRRIIIYGLDEGTGASCTATLSEAPIPVILRELNLISVTNKDGKIFTAGDTSSVFYIKYSAIDGNGNDTKDYKMIMDSLLFNGSNKLTVSSPMVRAEVVEDPDTPYKAAIKLTLVDGSSIPMDLPITITTVLIGGKAASMTFYLKKGN